MPVGDESKLGQYIDAFKEWLPSVRLRLGEWVDVCRAEPALIWQTPAVRYTTYATLALIGVYILSAVAGLFGPARVAEPARTADFNVVCTNPACGHHFVINRKFGYDDFPVQCPKCRQETGARALRYKDGPCAGQWAPVQTGDAGQLQLPPCVPAPPMADEPPGD